MYLGGRAAALRVAWTRCACDCLAPSVARRLALGRGSGTTVGTRRDTLLLAGAGCSPRGSRPKPRTRPSAGSSRRNGAAAAVRGSDIVDLAPGDVVYRRTTSYAPAPNSRLVISRQRRPADTDRPRHRAGHPQLSRPGERGRSRDRARAAAGYHAVDRWRAEDAAPDRGRYADGRRLGPIDRMADREHRAGHRGTVDSGRGHGRGVSRVAGWSCSRARAPTWRPERHRGRW